MLAGVPGWRHADFLQEGGAGAAWNAISLTVQVQAIDFGIAEQLEDDTLTLALILNLFDGRGEISPSQSCN